MRRHRQFEEAVFSLAWASARRHALLSLRRPLVALVVAAIILALRASP